MMKMMSGRHHPDRLLSKPCGCINILADGVIVYGDDGWKSAMWMSCDFDKFYFTLAAGIMPVREKC